MTEARFRKLAAIALVATVGVILWGAFVRATGSGAGCGSHWPTCNGEVIPKSAGMETLIELTHRVTSGAAFLLVALQLVWALRAFPAGHPVRGGAIASMALMIAEAAIGAGIVLFEYVAHNASIARAAWTSVHLVNTFLLVAAMTCTLWWAHGGARVRLGGRGATRDAVPALIAVALLGAILVGVTGALAALGDTLFAAASLREGLAQDVSPSAHFLVQLRGVHPILAACYGVYVLVARAAVAARRPSPANAESRPMSITRLSTATGVLVALQLAAGVVNLVLLAPVWMQLVHLLLADLFWLALVTLSVAALGEPAAEGARPGAPAQYEISSSSASG